MKKSYRYFVNTPIDRDDDMPIQIPIAPVPYDMEHDDRDGREFNDHRFNINSRDRCMPLSEYLQIK